MSFNSGDFAPNKRAERAMREVHDSTTGKKGKGHFAGKPFTHGNGSAGLSWIGAGLFILGIILGVASGFATPFWVLGGLAVQLWIVSAIIRPLEAIWTLLNKRLPK